MVKIKFFICLLILALIMVGCSSDSNMNESVEVIDDFLNEYYNQLNFSQEIWENIRASIEGVVSENTNEPIEYVNEFRKYLTEDCFDRMVNNRLIPNFNMEAYGAESVKINNLEIIKEEEGKYKVTYILKIKKANEENSFANNHEIRLLIADDKPLIDLISGDFVWE